MSRQTLEAFLRQTVNPAGQVNLFTEDIGDAAFNTTDYLAVDANEPLLTPGDHIKVLKAQVTINTQSFNAIVDSGATQCLMTDILMKKLLLEQHLQPTNRVFSQRQRDQDNDRRCSVQRGYHAGTPNATHGYIRMHGQDVYLAAGQHLPRQRRSYAGLSRSRLLYRNDGVLESIPMDFRGHKLGRNKDVQVGAGDPFRRHGQHCDDVRLRSATGGGPQQQR